MRTPNWPRTKTAGPAGLGLAGSTEDERRLPAPGAHEVVAVLRQRAQCGDDIVGGFGVKPVRRQRSDTNREGVGLIGLSAMTGGQYAHLAGQLGRHDKDVDTVRAQPGRQRCAQALGAFYRLPGSRRGGRNDAAADSRQG
jgi:hypothetical protein